MNFKHDLTHTDARISQLVSLRHGEPVELRAAHAGELDVRGALVWVTRAGDAADYFVAPGEQLVLAGGERLVVEPWQEGARAELHWRGRPAAATAGARAGQSRGQALVQRAPQRSV